jgi:hypothetical protein
VAVMYETVIEVAGFMKRKQRQKEEEDKNEE